MATHYAARIHDLHSVIEDHQTDSGRFQQIDMYKGILKQFFQHGLRDLQLSDGVKRLTVLCTAKARLQPHHGLLEHFRNGTFYITAITVFCSCDAVPVEPDGLDNKHRLELLRALTKKQQSRCGKPSLRIRDMKIVQQLILRHVKLCHGLAIDILEETVKCQRVNVSHRRIFHTGFVSVILA